MGQAQLLLIVLGVVIVGIAILAGIQAYAQNDEKAEMDAIAHESLRFASDLQVWAQKPTAFGGNATPYATPPNLCNTANATANLVGWDNTTQYSTITGTGAGPWTFTSNKYGATHFATLNLVDGNADADVCDPEDISVVVTNP